MKYIKSFQDAINESNSNGSHFYLVLRDTDIAFKNLSRGVFDNIIGISDNIGILDSFFDVRSVLLIMDKNEVLKINNAKPIEYYNLDNLYSNNLYHLKRIHQNHDVPKELDKKYKYDVGLFQSITKILQNISLIYRSGFKTIGNRKKFKIFGSWDKEGNKKFYRSVFSSLSSPSIQHRLSDYLKEKYKKGHFNVNTFDDFISLIEEWLKYESDNYDDDESRRHYSIRHEGYKGLKGIIKVYSDFGIKPIKDIISWSTMVTSKIYSKEGEWILQDKRLKIPPKSTLIFKEYNEEVFYKWVKKIGHSADTYGLKLDEIQEIIDKYDLNKKYIIKKVKHRMELKEHLKMGKEISELN